jgi:hypothetical protein
MLIILISIYKARLRAALERIRAADLVKSGYWASVATVRADGGRQMRLS